jgi:hypothetical protein
MPTVHLDNQLSANIPTGQGGYGGLVHHVMHLVRENRNVRDRKYKGMWDRFERTFRGLYTGSDNTREGERSRLVAPALAAAIESTAAAIEDAIFSRERWFDMRDDVADQQVQDIQEIHRRLEEDFDLAGVPDAIAKTVLNGCLYGTGVAKINVTRKEVRTIVNGEVRKDWRPLVTLDAIPPWEFVIDSQARDIDAALFVAHETHVPRNIVWGKQKSGAYRMVNIFGNTASTTASPAGEETPDGRRKHEEFDGSVFVTEYYGLVPAKMLKGIAEVKPEDIQGNGHVEVIVTIANELELLRAVVNPFMMRDRPIIAYQHSYVPGKFWGRGVAEKGWNAQRALDAELRARMDALGLLTSPMMGADITRLPRNPDMRVRPGKVWLTRGRPSEVLEPVILGNIDPNTFNQSSEMERLIQVGTGAIESNAPLNTDRRNETASGISMIQSSALKRMRRTMWNMERQFLNPLIKKATHRYMQFNKKRYPADPQFQVKGTMGVVAREFEQAQLIGLLSNVPPDDPRYNVLLQSIIELSVGPKRDEMLQRLQQQEQQQAQGAQQQQQLQQQMQQEALREQQLENAKTEMEIKKLEAEINQINVMTQLEDEKVDIQAANTVLGREKVRAQNRQIDVAEKKLKSDEKLKRAELRQKKQESANGKPTKPTGKG